MRVSDAYDKVMIELADAVKEKAGINEDMDAAEVVGVIGLARGVVTAYTFDEGLKVFVDQRSKKKATAMVDTLDDYSDPTAAFKALTEDLPRKFQQDNLLMFSMGYSFAGPENTDVPRDREGFLKLCQETDRDLITIQVNQFSLDGILLDRIQDRVKEASSFMDAVFSVRNVPPTKYGIRDWIRQVHGIISIDCFVAGAKVRELLEQEVTFEAMMKELNE